VRGAACIAHFNKEDSSETSRRIEEKSRRTIDRCPLRLNSLETEGGTKCIDDIQITTIELQTDFHKICWETRRQFDGIFTRSAAAPIRGGRRGAGRWSRRSRSPEQEEHSSRSFEQEEQGQEHLSGRTCTTTLLLFSSRMHTATGLGCAVAS
jgi:hypothetical protein